MAGCWIRWVEWWSFEVVLGDACCRMGMQDLIPADIWVQESPPHAIFSHFFHASAAVEEGRQHALPQLDDASIFLGLGRLGCVVGETVLFWDGWYDERRV